MDAPRFDTLLKQVGQRRDRREVLAGLLGAALLSRVGDAAAAKRGKSQAKRRGRVISQSNGECAAQCKELFSSKKDRGQCIAQAAQVAHAVPADSPCPCCPYSSYAIPNLTSEVQTVCGASLVIDCDAPCVVDEQCELASGAESVRCLFEFTDQTTGITTYMDNHCNAADGEKVCVRVAPCPQP